jgi:lysozyme
MLEGIDVSAAQGKSIDWTAVAAADRRFVFCKATDGAQGVDPTFAANAAHAAAAGLLVGGYHFFQPGDDPGEQAAHFAAVAKGSINWCPMIDIETLGKHGSQLTIGRTLESALECVEAIEQAFGQTCVVYTFAKFWSEWPNGYASRPLFVAQYNHRDTGVQDPTVPHPWDRWTLHQYAADPFPALGIPGGSCPGVQGAVDCDRFDGDEDALRALGQVGPT